MFTFSQLDPQPNWIFKLFFFFNEEEFAALGEGWSAR